MTSLWPRRQSALRRRLLQTLLVGSLTAALLLLIMQVRFFVRLQLTLEDTYFIPSTISDAIVLVALDDAAFAEYGRSLLDWPRSVYADLIDRVSAAGARVIAFDVLFIEPSIEPSGEDEALAQAMAAAGQTEARTRIVLAAAAADMPQPSTLAAFPAALRYQRVLLPAAPLNAAADMIGFVNIFPDADGRIRRQPSVIEADDALYVSFPLAAYLAYLRVPAAALPEVMRYAPGVLSVTPERQVPVDANGIWRQNFFGTAQQTSFTTVSLGEVLAGGVEPTVFADKIVLVGVMNAVGSTDDYPVPVALAGEVMAGVAIHANAVETLLRGALLYEVAAPLQVVSVVGLTLLGTFLYIGLKWYFKLILAFCLCIGWLLLAFLLFSTTRTLMPLLHPLLALSMPAFIGIGLEINQEILRRRSTEHLLKLNEALARQVTEQNTLLETIQNESPSGILVLDYKLNIVRCNRYFKQVVEASPRAELVGRPALELLKTDSDNQYQALMQQFDARKPFYMEYVRGEQTYNLVAARPTNVPLWVIVLHDVTALAELNKLRTRMIRMASHDLKNPLSSVMLITGLIEMDKTLDQKNRHYLDMIQKSSREMQRIIENVLEVERARSNVITRTKVPLNEVVREVAASYEADLVTKRHTLKLEMAEAPLALLGERGSLTQMLGNLVSNAIKYTPDGGQITLRLQRSEQVARIEVQDSGYGIPEDAQKKLFTDFYRVRTRETANIPGTGLGLSLVKSIVEAHEGKIWVESTPGQGSTFFVELPVLPAPA